MMKVVNAPLFCLTSDVDWASDHALQEFLELVGGYGVKATVFATHSSRVVEDAHAKGALELGIHPNFLPGSTHGNDILSVVEHMCRLFPQASTFRSHCFYDNSHVTTEMVRRGFTYDSNVCLYLQPNLVPLRHASGLVRFPVFWEDDAHWLNTDDWTLDRYVADFTSPGLKILNFHPFFVAANIPSQDYYRSVKKYIPTLGPADIKKVRYPGPGAQTFLKALLDFLSARRERFYTLRELYHMLPLDKPSAIEDKTAGRHTTHTDEDHVRYWSLSDREKQEVVRRAFEQRDPKDPYATSRDYNARELEINSLRRYLNRDSGRILDLGCGNGYTLISLARELKGWEMVGVDFSSSLIAGASALCEATSRQLQSQPRFIEADAIEYVKRQEDETIDYLVTERFLQNLPSKESQRAIILQAFRLLAPGGRLLMCEGSEDGFERLNDVREAVGLSRVPATSGENVSAIRFSEKDIEEFARNVGFVFIDKAGYSTYFIIARILHPLLVAPQSPRFDARINDLACQIQKSLPYQAGYGSNVLWVFEKPGETRQGCLGS